MPASAEPAIGTELAGYRLEALLGRGGMGVVYRARDLALDRDVALKLLAPHLAEDVSFRERFLTESRVAASLEHPNVVPIHDAGEIDGQLFIVMRLVVGSDLKVVLRGGPLEPARAVRIVEQIASALDAAHARGLVHRDVKPSNVLLDEHGHVYLADFGLSRYLGDAASTLGPGRSLGTADYVAPEQIRCEEVDGRTDVYALGCLLYECLAGEPPFRRGSDAATLFAQLEENPPTLPGLEDVLPKALAKDPADRYPTCGELIADAREALGITEPKRNRWPLAFAAVGITLITAALAGYFLSRDGGSSSQLPGRDSLVRIDPTTNEVAATIRVGEDPSAVAVSKDGVWVASRADGIVRRIDPATNAIVLATPAHGRPTELAVIPGSVLVSNGPLDTNVTVIDAPTGRETNVISLTRGGGFAGSAHIAADGSDVWLAGIDRNVGRLDLTAARVVDPVSIPAPGSERADAYFSSVGVSDDAIWVLGDINDPTLSRIDRGTGHVKRIRLPFAPKEVAVESGSVWVTSQLDDTLSRIDPATTAITSTVHVGRGASGVAVGAGSVWVANEIDGTVSRIDPETLRVLDTIDVGGSPDHVAVGDGAVWVTTHGIGDTLAKRDDNTIDIGILTACDGNYGFLSDVSNAGAELPLLHRGGTLIGKETVDGVTGATVAGKKIKLHFGCGDDSAEKALSEARRLVEQVGVDILIGPTQLNEGFAIRDYARRQPGVTFLNGTGAGQAVTLEDAAPNFYRFSTDGAQGTAGLGAYAYRKLGWRNVVTVGEDEAYNYTEVAGFVAEFCALGGTIAERIWVPLTVQDYGPSAERVPRRGVDGFFMAGSSATTLGVTKELPQLHGDISGKVMLTILSSSGGSDLDNRFNGVVVGMPIPVFYAGPIPPAMRAWRRYVEEFARTFPRLAPFAGTSFSVLYDNGMEAALVALESVDGDLSDGQHLFQAALATVRLTSPTGPIRLDRKRQAVGQSFLNRYGTTPDGRVAARMFKMIPNVEQSFGGYFQTNGAIPSRTSPTCVKRVPPPWAR